MSTTLLHYTYSLRLLPPAIRVLLGVRSSDSHDAAILLRGAHLAPRSLNTHNILADSPFLLTLKPKEGFRLLFRQIAGLRAMFDAVNCDPDGKRIVSLRPKPTFHLIFAHIPGLIERDGTFDIQRGEG